MENATDALIMAGSVLLLVIALTVSISSLTNMRAQVQDILADRGQLEPIKDEEGNYINYFASNNSTNNDNDVRTVGVETIISSIRRMAKENYTIYIKSNNLDSSLPKELKINAKKQKYSDTTIIGENDEILELTMKGNEYDKYLFPEEGTKNQVIEKVYNMLKENSYKEYIGIYKEETAEEVLDAEKQTYKIITFVQT